MLRIDTREKGQVPTKLNALSDSEMVLLNAGDYHIDTPEGIIVIERTRLDDFIGKIKSGRIDTQIETCTNLSEKVILILEGMHNQSHSKMSYKSIVAKIGSLSQRGIQIICLRNGSETYEFIKKLHMMYIGNATTSDFNRIKKKNMTLNEQSLFMLMGINGIGPAIARSFFNRWGSIENFVKQTEGYAGLTKAERVILKTIAHIYSDQK